MNIAAVATYEVTKHEVLELDCIETRDCSNADFKSNCTVVDNDHDENDEFVLMSPLSPRMKNYDISTTRGENRVKEEGQQQQQQPLAPRSLSVSPSQQRRIRSHLSQNGKILSAQSDDFSPARFRDLSQLPLPKHISLVPKRRKIVLPSHYRNSKPSL